MTEQTMTGPARLRQIAEFTILSAAEPRQLAAAWEADRAANERLTAAASGRGMVSEMDGLPEIAVLVVGLHERAEAAEAALEQVQNALLVRDHQYQATKAALERARAVERQLRIASDDPRASYETSRAYERAANDLDAALGVALVSAQTCQECGHLESEHRSVAGGLGFACRHAGCDCIKEPLGSGGAA